MDVFRTVLLKSVHTIHEVKGNLSIFINEQVCMNASTKIKGNG